MPPNPFKRTAARPAEPPPPPPPPTLGSNARTPKGYVLVPQDLDIIQVRLTPRSRIAIECPGVLTAKTLEKVRDDVLEWIRTGIAPVVLMQGLRIVVLELPENDEALNP